MSTIRILMLCAAMCLTLSMVYPWSVTYHGMRVWADDDTATHVILVTVILSIMVMEVWYLWRARSENSYMAFVGTLWAFTGTIFAWAR